MTLACQSVQVLRLIQLMGKQRKQSSLKNTGALLVLLWTEKGSSHQRINCTGKMAVFPDNLLNFDISCNIMSITLSFSKLRTARV